MHSQPNGDNAQVKSFLARNATNEHLETFFTSKLQLMSPCEDAFQHLALVPGFVCCQFADLADPGEVLLQHWPEDAPPSGRLRPQCTAHLSPS